MPLSIENQFFLLSLSFWCDNNIRSIKCDAISSLFPLPRFWIVSFKWKTFLFHVVFLSGRIFAYNFSYVEIVLFFTQWYLIWLDSTYAIFLPCFCVFLFTLLLYLARLTFTLYVFWSWLTLSLFVFHQQGMSFPLTIRLHQQLDRDFLSFQAKTWLRFPLLPSKVCNLFPFLSHAFPNFPLFPMVL